MVSLAVCPNTKIKRCTKKHLEESVIESKYSGHLCNLYLTIHSWTQGSIHHIASYYLSPQQPSKEEWGESKWYNGLICILSPTIQLLNHTGSD